MASRVVPGDPTEEHINLSLKVLIELPEIRVKALYSHRREQSPLCLGLGNGCQQIHLKVLWPLQTVFFS